MDIEVPQRRQKNVFKEIKAEYFLNLMHTIKQQIQESNNFQMV